MQSKLEVTLFGPLGECPALQLPGQENRRWPSRNRPCVDWSPTSTPHSLLNPEQLDEARQELDRVLERWADIHEGLLLDVEVHGR